MPITSASFASFRADRSKSLMLSEEKKLSSKNSKTLVSWMNEKLGAPKSSTPSRDQSRASQNRSLHPPTSAGRSVAQSTVEPCSFLALTATAIIFTTSQTATIVLTQSITLGPTPHSSHLPSQRRESSSTAKNNYNFFSLYPIVFCFPTPLSNCFETVYPSHAFSFRPCCFLFCCFIVLFYFHALCALAY